MCCQRCMLVQKLCRQEGSLGLQTCEWLPSEWCRCLVNTRGTIDSLHSLVDFYGGNM